MYLTASEDPIAAIIKASYEGQHISKRMYVSGYDHFLDRLPLLADDTTHLKSKVGETQGVMKELYADLVNDPFWKDVNIPGNGQFNRTIIAIAEPQLGSDSGKEIIVARWGDGFSSPIHGHSDGYMHEQVIFGKIRVDTYRIIDQKYRIVRPVSTVIVTPGEAFVSEYSFTKKDMPERSTLVHSFTSIGFSATLHYLPEHTRDGRDNAFKPEYFEDIYPLTNVDVNRITSKEGLYLKKGEVVLVRSENVPEYVDHYIVITGHPVVKEHGLRPQDVAIHAPGGYKLLDQYDMNMGLTLLKLSPEATEQFLDFHDIKKINDEIIFPKP